MFYQIKVVAQASDGSSSSDLGTCWVKTDNGEPAAISAAIEQFWDPRLTAGDASVVATVLQSWDEDEDDQDAAAELVIDDAEFRATAHELKHRDGELEVDDAAVVSQGSDNGAYVQAWVWIRTDEVLEHLALKADAPKEGRREASR